MKIRFLNFFLFVFCLLTGIDMVAQTADVNAGCEPLRVTFSAPDDATSFFWDFKDGGTSDLANPSNVFNAGVYEVDFRTASGGEVIGTVTITVVEKPALMVTASPPSGCSPLDVVLTNSTALPAGVEILSQQWVFDDGTQATGDAINRTYESEGSYSLSLAMTTSSENCNGTQQFVDLIEVVAGPQVSFTTGPASSCQGPLTVAFANQTPNAESLTFQWDFGNGVTSNNINPESQTYTADGDYTVTLSATDSEKGCTKTFSRTVSIGSPTADFEVPAKACVGEATTFNNLSSAGSYIWEIQGLTTLTGANPEVNFPASGDYQVRLIVTSGNGECSNEVTKTVSVDIADASFNADPIYSCMEPTAVTFTPNSQVADATYEWDFGDDSTSTTPSVVHEYVADNDSPYHENGEFKFTPTLTVTTASGCTATASSEVVLDIPLARFMPDTVSGCAPLSVEFSDSSRSTQNILSWEWIYDNGETNNFSTADPHDYTFTEPGEYDVQLVITNDLGCVDSSYTVRVEVGTRISPDFTTDQTSVCQGDTIQFTDVTNSDLIDEWHYYTDDDRSSHCFSEANPMIKFETSTGAFNVNMVVGYNGCLDSIVKADFLEVKGPIAHIDYVIPCVTPKRVTFNSSSEEATGVTWDFGDGATETLESFNHEYGEDGDYLVTLTAENPASGCPASVDTATVHIRTLVSMGEVKFEQCKNLPVSLDASAAMGVDTSCSRGYTWHFNHPAVRPLTINEPTNMEIGYPDTGNYIIELVVEDINGCVDTSEYPVRVFEAIADFEMDKSTICFPMAVNFTNNSTTTAESIETYMWSFGDGVGMAETENANYNYSLDPGGSSVTVTLSIEDSAGCPSEKTMNIETYRPISRITANPNPNICAGETINFSATDFTERGSNLAYSWDLGNGAGSDMMTTSTPYNAGGTYNVVLNFREIATGCTGSAEAVVNVQDYPIARFITDVDGENPLCHPKNITFTNASDSEDPLTSVWDFGNGQSGVGNQTAQFFDKGMYTVSLSTQTSFGCADQISRDFNLVGPTGDIEVAGGPFCVGDVVSASAVNLSEVSDYSWFFEGQEFGANQTDVTFTVTEVPQGGQSPLTIELMGPEGCNFAPQAFVAVSQVGAAFTANPEVCSPDVSFVNESVGGNVFMWDFGNGETSNNVSPSVNYAEAGTYTVSLLVENSANGCMEEIAQQVVVNNPNPAVARGLDTCITAGSSVTLPIQNNGVALLLFDNQIGLSCPTGGAVANCTTPVVSATEDAIYTLTIQDQCFGNQTFNYSIGVFDASNGLIPNAFTPNGDMNNDFFNVIGLSDPNNPTPSLCSTVDEVLSFQIWDRWGTRVYNNDTPSRGWDGNYKGKRQNPDVYIFVIKVRLTDGTETVLEGDVTLIR